MQNRIWFVSWLIMTPYLVGCGGEKSGNREPVFPVSGKVIYKGQPVVAADVTFFCKEKNMSSFGRTDERGQFKLTSFSSNDGAPAGKHVIMIAKSQPAAAPTQEVDVTDPAYDPTAVEKIVPTPPAKDPIPAKYADAAKTDLFAVVTADSPNPEITLELKD